MIGPDDQSKDVRRHQADEPDHTRDRDGRPGEQRADGDRAPFEARDLHAELGGSLLPSATRSMSRIEQHGGRDPDREDARTTVTELHPRALRPPRSQK